jgi:hypothetical protein
MKQYLLSVCTTGWTAPAPEVLERIMSDLPRSTRRLAAEGAWVFAAGLHPASSATVIRVRDGEELITDGPFTEGKEHLGGFTIIAARDLDAALGWATGWPASPRSRSRWAIAGRGRP